MNGWIPLILLSLISMGIAVVCFRQGTVARRRYRKGRGQPLLASVTLDQLRQQPVDWPVNADRWPPPNPTGGALPMEPVLARAYARLADRVQHTYRIAAQVLALIGGSWLGVTIPIEWQNYRQSSLEATEALRRNDTWDFVVVGFRFDPFTIIPIILVTVAAVLMVLDRFYGVAVECYRRAAVPEVEPALEQIMPEKRPGLLGRLYSALRS